mgnify:CR=1 FL=1
MHMLSPRNSGFSKCVSQCLSGIIIEKIDRYVMYLLISDYIVLMSNKIDSYLLLKGKVIIMKTLSYTIKDEQGIHARPAGELVKAAKGYTCEIKIGKGGNMVDAKKIFGIMGLGAKKGDTVEFTFSGEDEEQAYTAISDFMNANL